MKRPSLINDASSSKQRVGVISTIDQERVQAYALGQVPSKQPSGYKLSFTLFCIVVITLGLAFYWLAQRPSSKTLNIETNVPPSGSQHEGMRRAPLASESDNISPSSSVTNNQNRLASTDVSQEKQPTALEQANEDSANVATIVDTSESSSPPHGTPIESAFEALNQPTPSKQGIDQTRKHSSENKPSPSRNQMQQLVSTENRGHQIAPPTAIVTQERKIPVDPPVAKAKMQATPSPSPQEQKSRAGDVAVISALLANDKIPAKPVEPSAAKAKELPNKFRINNEEKHSAVDLSAVAHHSVDAVELRWRQCEELDFFERQTCRWKACEGGWGRSENCPSASAQPNIFNQAKPSP